MTVSTTPSIVAGKLTEAMKVAVLSFAPPFSSFSDYGMMREWADVCQLAGKRRSFHNTIKPLIARGLAEEVEDGFVRLNRLGIEVRALLHKEEGCG